MSKQRKTTIFDQRGQKVTKQTNIAGSENQSIVIHEGVSLDQVQALYADAVSKIQASGLGSEKKAEMIQAVQTVQDEIGKSQNADRSLLRTLLTAVVEQIPEIAEVLLAAILNPAAGAAPAVKLLAKEVLQIAQPKD